MQKPPSADFGFWRFFRIASPHVLPQDSVDYWCSIIRKNCRDVKGSSRRNEKREKFNPSYCLRFSCFKLPDYQITKSSDVPVHLVPSMASSRIRSALYVGISVLVFLWLGELITLAASCVSDVPDSNVQLSMPVSGFPRVKT